MSRIWNWLLDFAYTIREIAEAVAEALRAVPRDLPLHPRWGDPWPCSTDLAGACGWCREDHAQRGNEPMCDVVAMDKHGEAAATDPWEAFEHIERLNHVCEIFLLSR